MQSWNRSQTTRLLYFNHKTWNLEYHLNPKCHLSLKVSRSLWKYIWVAGRQRTKRTAGNYLAIFLSRWKYQYDFPIPLWVFSLTWETPDATFPKLLRANSCFFSLPRMDVHIHTTWISWKCRVFNHFFPKVLFQIISLMVSLVKNGRIRSNPPFLSTLKFSVENSFQVQQIRRLA